MEEILKNCLNIIREQKEKINFLETQNSQLNTLLSQQTKLLVDYAYFYEGEASKFIPDENYEKLINSLENIQHLDMDTLQTLQLLQMKMR